VEKLNKNHLIISLIFIVTTIACGCAGGGYQDRQWEYSMQHRTSLLSSDFKTLVTYGQYIRHSADVLKKITFFLLSFSDICSKV